MSNLATANGTVKLNAYARVAYAGLSHGAFHLWHVLHLKSNKDGVCWPGQRTLRDAIKCDRESLTKWTTELSEAGFLEILPERAYRGGYKYLVLDGAGGVMRKGTSSVAPKGDTGNSSGREMPSAKSSSGRVLPRSSGRQMPSASGREMPSTINYNLNTSIKEEDPPWAKRRDLKAKIETLEALIAERKKNLPVLANRTLYPDEYEQDIKLRAVATAEIKELQAKLSELKKQQLCEI